MPYDVQLFYNAIVSCLPKLIKKFNKELSNVIPVHWLPNRKPTGDHDHNLV